MARANDGCTPQELAARGLGSAHFQAPMAGVFGEITCRVPAGCTLGPQTLQDNLDYRRHAITRADWVNVTRLVVVPGHWSRHDRQIPCDQ